MEIWRHRERAVSRAAGNPRPATTPCPDDKAQNWQKAPETCYFEWQVLVSVGDRTLPWMDCLGAAEGSPGLVCFHSRYQACNSRTQYLLPFPVRYLKPGLQTHSLPAVIFKLPRCLDDQQQNGQDVSSPIKQMQKRLHLGSPGWGMSPAPVALLVLANLLLSSISAGIRSFAQETPLSRRLTKLLNTEHIYYGDLR